MTPSAGEHTVMVEHLTKSYGDTTVVDDLSFTVEPGRVTGFLGPNGSGKSTTMKMILDLAAADRGRATIGASRYRDLVEPARTVGAMIESDAFHPGRSGRNHLRILADATGIPRRRADEMLEAVGLANAARRNAGAYSLGMRQRLGLAAALLGEPPVLILDEPGNGLDPEGIHTLRDRLRAHAAGGGTVFVSSHLLGEVEHLADDVVVIKDGRLITQGSLAELQQAASLVRATDPARLAEVLRQAGGSTEARGPDALVVRGLPIDEIGERAFTAGIVLHELSPQAGSLEELFLTWTAPAVRRPGGQPAMITTQLVRSELRKLTTTRMPWAFLAVLVLLAGLNAFAVTAGTDMDGSKAFISTEADQQSLMAFAANALAIAGLFGAIAVAREYGHHTVVPTFLASPHRHRAVLAQLGAVAAAGAVLGLVGAGLTVAAVALSLPTTEFGFLVSPGNVTQVLAASAFAGATGAVLGAGIGSVVRNVGGAVTGTVLALFIAPPLVVQLAGDTASWMPGVLANTISGVANDVSLPAGIAALVVWALVPAIAGLIAVQRRDVI